MTDTIKGIAPALPSATVVILRDGAAGIEVFMVVRHHEIDFASGALVFPGGKVDAQDTMAEWTDLAPLESNPPMRSFFIAAIRETFEEAGFLLARRRGTAALLGADDTRRLVDSDRDNVLKGQMPFADLIRRENLQLAMDLMVPFAHWVTPVVMPKRFDTHFLLVAAPVEQLGAHDGAESVEGIWLTPAQAIADGSAGTRTVLPPTRLNLQKLAGYPTVAEAVLAARAQDIVTVLPEVHRAPGGTRLLIPASAGYGVSEIFMPGRK